MEAPEPGPEQGWARGRWWGSGRCYSTGPFCCRVQLQPRLEPGQRKLGCRICQAKIEIASPILVFRGLLPAIIITHAGQRHGPLLGVAINTKQQRPPPGPVRCCCWPCQLRSGRGTAWKPDGRRRCMDPTRQPGMDRNASRRRRYRPPMVEGKRPEWRGTVHTAGRCGGCMALHRSTSARSTIHSAESGRPCIDASPKSKTMRGLRQTPEKWKCIPCHFHCRPAHLDG